MSKQSREQNELNMRRNIARKAVRNYGVWSKDGTHGTVQTVVVGNHGHYGWAIKGVFHSNRPRTSHDMLTHFIGSGEVAPTDIKSRRIIATNAKRIRGWENAL